ncbi:MAG: hypothetical protein PHV06_05775 [bacterium]|nr:hypothetical protein [bacterium]
MSGSLLEVIIEPISNIFFNIVLLSYFITFVFTMLFFISKVLLMGEISNIFFIISAILHLILVYLQAVSTGLFLFDSLFKVLLVVSAVVIAIYIGIELMYKIKMGGIFIVVFSLAVFSLLLFREKEPFKIFPSISIYNNICYLILLTGYFLYIGSYINSSSIYLASVAYPHIIKKTIDIYVNVSKRFDLIALTGLIVSFIFRIFVFKELENIFLWKGILVQCISFILIFIIIRSLLLYKTFETKKGLLGFYKILGLIGWIVLLFINPVII